MWTLAVLLLLVAGSGCASQPLAVSSPSPAEAPAPSPSSSCSIVCENDGRPVSAEVACYEGFEAVCTCNSLPNASCTRVSAVNGQ